jgi:CPA2 family monovalent cation:H+ antiporter-2
MPDLHVLQDTIVILAIAVGVLMICGRLRLPSVVGLLIAGAVIGPSGFSLLSRVEEVEVFAEIGVALLLFLIGLELSMDQLRELRRIFFIGGVIQVVSTAALVMVAALLLGFEWQSSLFFGFVVALSSTAVVLKSLQDRRESHSPQGNLALGLLLFQDFLVVPMIVLVPLLAGAIEATPAALAMRLGSALLVIGLVFFVARFAMPRLLRELAAAQTRETFILGALLVGLGMAVFTEKLGFSLALGAFLAGLLISETEFGPQVIADIGPLRDVLASLFFLSIGMLVDIGLVADRLPVVLAVASAMVVVKLLTTGLAVVALGFPMRVVGLTSLVLAQVGEFSFVLLALAGTYELVDPALYQTLLAAAVLTLLATPFLIAAGPALTGRMRTAAEPAVASDRVGLEGHVVICGYGVNGQVLSRILGEASIRYRVLEINSLVVRDAKRDGVDIVFGDSTRPEILHHVNIESAKVVVLAISDARATAQTIQLVRQLNPTATVIARTRRVDEIAELRALGADLVISEEFETAIEILTRVLQSYHVPRHVIRMETRMLRGESYEMLRTPKTGEGVNEAVLHALTAGTTDLFQVSASAHAVGKTLRELDLRSATGTTVVAVMRGELPNLSPPPHLELETGDTLVLVGAHEQIDRALLLLESGPA